MALAVNILALVLSPILLADQADFWLNYPARAGVVSQIESREMATEISQSSQGEYETVSLPFWASHVALGGQAFVEHRDGTTYVLFPYQYAGLGEFYAFLYRSDASQPPEPWHDVFRIKAYRGFIYVNKMTDHWFWVRHPD